MSNTKPNSPTNGSPESSESKMSTPAPKKVNLFTPEFKEAVKRQLATENDYLRPYLTDRQKEQDRERAEKFYRENPDLDPRNKQ